MTLLTFLLVADMLVDDLWPIGIRLLGTLTLIAGLWSTLLGIHALVPRQSYTGQQARILKLFGVMLAEPALSLLLIPQLLFGLNGLWRMPWFYALAVTLPMSLLVIPAMYASFRDPLYRSYQRTLLLLGAARWTVRWSAIALLLATERLQPALLAVDALLLIGGVAWGHAVLAGSLRYPRDSAVEIEQRPRNERWRDL